MGTCNTINLIKWYLRYFSLNLITERCLSFQVQVDLCAERHRIQTDFRSCFDASSKPHSSNAIYDSVPSYKCLLAMSWRTHNTLKFDYNFIQKNKVCRFRSHLTQLVNKSHSSCHLTMHSSFCLNFNECKNQNESGKNYEVWEEKSSFIGF